jgi:hypothetical protein
VYSAVAIGISGGAYWTLSKRRGRARLMRFAIGLGSGQTPSDRSGIAAMVDAAQTAEDLGFDAVVAPDHYVFEALGTLQTEAPAYELFFVLATIAHGRRAPAREPRRLHAVPPPGDARTALRADRRGERRTRRRPASAPAGRAPSSR